MTSQKTISSHAHVAKLCRQYLKARSIKAKVASKSYSGGCSVTVRVVDQVPAVMEEIKKAFSQYEYGHFNGMEDIYEYSNSRSDIPQVKFLFVENDYSDELTQQAWTFIRNRCHGADQHPENYSDVPHSARVFNEWASTIVYQLLNGSLSSLANEFWAKMEAAA